MSVEDFVEQGNQATADWFVAHEKAAAEALEAMFASVKKSEGLLKSEMAAAKKVYNEAVKLGFSKVAAERISGYHV